MSSLTIPILSILSVIIAFVFNFAYFLEVGLEFLGVLGVQDYVTGFFSSAFWVVLGNLVGAMSNYVNLRNTKRIPDGNDVFPQSVLRKHRGIASIVASTFLFIGFVLIVGGSLFQVHSVVPLGAVGFAICGISLYSLWFATRVPLLADSGILKGLTDFEIRIFDHSVAFLLLAALAGYGYGKFDLGRTDPKYSLSLSAEDRILIFPIRLTQTGIIARSVDDQTIRFFPWHEVKSLIQMKAP